MSFYKFSSMKKIIFFIVLYLSAAAQCISQNIEYGAVIGASRGLFANTIESFDTEEFILSTGSSPLIGIYGQKSYNDLLALNWEIQLSSHEIAFTHSIEDEFISYKIRFSESISQLKFLFSNNSKVMSLGDNMNLIASLGAGGSLHTFSRSSWSQDVSLLIAESDSLYDFSFTTSDHLGMKKFIPEGFLGIGFRYSKKILFFKSASLRLTYHYLFRNIIDSPSKYSSKIYKDKIPYRNYEASWAGRLTYFDLVLRLAVF